MPNPQQNNHSTLIDAYNKMVFRVKNSLEETEYRTIPTLQKSMQTAMEQAKQEAIHLGEVSIEDAEEISRYIKHDITDAIEYLVEYSRDFSDWLMLDIDIIERKIMALFLSVADQTRIELAQLAHARRPPGSENHHEGKPF